MAKIPDTLERCKPLLKKLFIIPFFLSLFLLAGCQGNPVIVDNQTKSVNVVNLPLSDGALITDEYYFACDKGLIDGCYTVHKFGANDGVGTTLEPISLSGNYQTPQTAQTLEILSSSALDTSAGIGARKVLVIGLNSSGDEIQEEVTLTGTTPVTLSNQFLRVYRAYVTESGSYATQTTPSHYGDITLRGTGGGVTWALIEVIDGGFGIGQTEIGVYTVPRGKHCYLMNKLISVNSVKAANVYFFQRQNITKTTAPYSSMRLVEKQVGVSGTVIVEQKSPLADFPELTDIGFMGEVGTGTAELSVEFELLCLNKE